MFSRFHPAEFLANESLRPDLNRGVRAMFAFMLPLLAAHAGWVKIDPLWMSLAANVVALTDIRGSYRSRLFILMGVTGILCVSSLLGTAARGHLPWALAGMGVVALGGGLWRHISVDYGPGVAVSSGLMFLISLAPGHEGIHNPVLPTLAGGLFGILLQVAVWPFRPQYPMRRSVGESWVCLAEWLENSVSRVDPASESEFREAMNRSQKFLHAAAEKHDKLASHLEELNLHAARLAVRMRALRAATATFSTFEGHASFAEGMMPVERSMRNLAHSMALAVVTRQESARATVEIRLKRLESLIAVAGKSALTHFGSCPRSHQIVHLLEGIAGLFPAISSALQATMDGANERAGFSMELRDLSRADLRPMVMALGGIWHPPERALVLHTLRVSVLTVAGAAFYLTSGLEHGYWLPFTVLVVLQPDFGSTKQKAAQRVIGTVAGGLAASFVLWLHPPLPVVFVCLAAAVFFYGWFFKRNYALAVVFITLLVVLLTEAAWPVTWEFTLERVGITVAGGLLSMIAAWMFWPVWESSRFPRIVVLSFAATRALLDEVMNRILEGRADDDSLLAARRAAETAAARSFSSLRRMTGDPKNQRDALETAAALANGNRRVIDALGVISLHLDGQRTLFPTEAARFQRLAGIALETLIACETGMMPEVSPPQALRALEGFATPRIPEDRCDPAQFREPWVWPQVSRILTELAAMLVLMRPEKSRE